jgi:hypothetical protein
MADRGSRTRQEDTRVLDPEDQGPDATERPIIVLDEGSETQLTLDPIILFAMVLGGLLVFEGGFMIGLLLGH